MVQTMKATVGELTKREAGQEESQGKKDKKKRKKSLVSIHNQIGTKKSVITPYPYAQTNHTQSVASIILPQSSTNVLLKQH